MENINPSEGPIVPPAVDEAELLGITSNESTIDQTEPRQENLNFPLDTAEQQGLLLEETLHTPVQEDGIGSARVTRPGLRRDNSVPSPAPLHLPPPAPPAPPPDTNQSTESLPLQQLQNLVHNLPRTEPTPYSFTYDDASSLEDELEEWFSYSVEEQAMLLKAHTSFSEEWGAYRGNTYERGTIDWEKTEFELRREFVLSLLAAIEVVDPVTRLRKLETLVYILLGCWHETAGRCGVIVDSATHAKDGLPHSEKVSSTYNEKSGVQVDLLRKNVRLFVECDGLHLMFQMLRSTCLRACGLGVDPAIPRDTKDAERREVWCALTTVYLALEVGRADEKENNSLFIRSKVLSLSKPGLFLFLADLITRMRWDETITLPITKICLLAWKTLLVSLGGLAEVAKAKDSFRDKDQESEGTRGQPMITASPLDYHLFRQEISSKYPAYNPPPPLFPLEPENNSILPPLKNHPNKVAGNHVFGSGLGDMNGNNTSIFQQPVHIATPAPSPPPSPAGPGGKGGKKQNYQTNQLFPFLYPPLDESSNNLGGKGSTDLQDVLVGRKWEGSDIPASILEAAELFSKRMRATRAMKQLWEERVQFMKYERGWSAADEDLDVESLSLEPKEGDVIKDAPEPGSVEERMNIAEEYYRTTLPYLQSLIIVLIRAILAHVTALVTQSNGSSGLQSGFQFQDGQNGQVTNGAHTDAVNGHNGSITTNEELDAMRTQEILDKAVSGIIMLLLKWFKVSHILKYEYLTQLLVDTSYVPLILKLFQLQEIEKVVNSKCEQEEINFFHFCRTHSRLGAEEAETRTRDNPDSESDDAVPPPIRLTREETNGSETDQVPVPTTPQPPEVDELGLPTTELPKEPITNYSWRAFFTSINYLRIMQKICKNKAHRNLMLVSYKSSQFLRKSLKVPEPLLRHYTLKLFKNQVPYCGRKWRQTNMRVITAVYLNLRPELRDDWLAGSDVDAEVDESVPLEQALRALTHWFNLKRYPEGMGAKIGILGEEQDFFRRELEKMDWGEDLVSASHDGDADGSGWDVNVEGW